MLLRLPANSEVKIPNLFLRLILPETYTKAIIDIINVVLILTEQH